MHSVAESSFAAPHKGHFLRNIEEIWTPQWGQRSSLRERDSPQFGQGRTSLLVPRKKSSMPMEKGARKKFIYASTIRHVLNA